MTQQTINIGASANDGTGDNLRVAFGKCNDNFTELYAGFSLVADTSPSLGGDLDVNGFAITSGSGNIELDDLTVNNSTISTVSSGVNINLTTSGSGVVNINAINATSGNINGVIVGATTPAQGTFANLFSNNHAPVTDGIYSSGTSSYRWSEVNTLLLKGSQVVLANPITMTTGGAISLLRSYVNFDSTAGAFTPTLADGVDGQLLVLTMIVDGGDVDLTPTNKVGFTSITFNDVGDNAMLMFSGTKWMLLASRGATVV